MNSTLTIIEFLTVTGAIFVLVAVSVIIGGWLVFRTKREAHEPLLPVSQPKGKAVNYDFPDAALYKTYDTEEEEDAALKAHDEATDKFMRQFGLRPQPAAKTQQ